MEPAHAQWDPELARWVAVLVGLQGTPHRWTALKIEGVAYPWHNVRSLAGQRIASGLFRFSVDQPDKGMTGGFDFRSVVW